MMTPAEQFAPRGPVRGAASGTVMAQKRSPKIFQKPSATAEERARVGKRRRRRAVLFAACAVLLCVFGLFGLGSVWQRLWPASAGGGGGNSDLPTGAPVVTATPTPSPTPTATPTPEPTPIVETVSFSATGDNLIHQAIYTQAAARAKAEDSEEAYDFDYCYENIAPFYAQYDVNWINQETLCNDELAPSTYPCFSTPGACARALYRAGVRVFSLANNHTYDKGASGIAATLRFWASMPEDTVTTGLWRGTEDYDNIPVQTVNGVTIAYLSYTEHTNGIQQNSKMEANVIYTSQLDVIERQVRAAAELADFVVVGTHWGTEDSHTINSNQRALAQKLADWGADVIVGTHPHVLQNAEWLTAADGRQTFVAYSLGNFLSTQSHTDQLIGAILTLDLQKVTDPDGTVTLSVLQPKLHPTVTHYGTGKTNVRTYLFRDYTPELAAAHGVRAAYSEFSYAYIKRTAETYIDAEFLDLE
jgi:poly-gamma-glutamate synthesis protein (capsule biosynthesis protein)